MTTLRRMLLLGLSVLVSAVGVASAPLLMMRMLRTGPQLLGTVVIAVVPARVGHCYRVSHSSVTTTRQGFTDLVRRAAAAHGHTLVGCTARSDSFRTYVPAGILDEPSWARLAVRG